MKIKDRTVVVNNHIIKHLVNEKLNEKGYKIYTESIIYKGDTDYFFVKLPTKK